MELARMLDHAVAPIRRNDAQAHVFRLAYMIFVRMIHGAWMKGSDLIIRKIGCDKSLCGKGVTHLAYMGLSKAKLVQPTGVGLIVVAHCGHDQRLPPDHL